MLDYVKPEVVQKFLDALPAALALMDHDEKVIWVNGSFLRITCLERDDVTQLQGLIEDRENLKSKVAELNPIDQATGLPNRRALFQSLEQQCSRSRRYGNALSIMLLRMDNLAEYTKIFGGDNTNQLLLQVSQALNDQTRWADMIGRLDSNEFLLILPETEEIETRGLKEKLNTAMAAINLPGAEGTDFCLSVNFGMGQWRKGDDSDMLMQRAKQNLQGEKEEKLAV
jgi:diguanylate cyclase (GGDEF)-like protein